MVPQSLRRIACAALCAGVSAAEPSAESVRKALPVDRGLVIHAGADGPELAVALAREAPLVVHVLLRDAAKEQAARAALVKARLHGQATVARWHEPRRLPFLARFYVTRLLLLFRYALSGDRERAQAILQGMWGG